MRNIIQIEPKWLIEVAPRYYRAGDPTKVRPPQLLRSLPTQLRREDASPVLQTLDARSCHVVSLSFALRAVRF